MDWPAHREAAALILAALARPGALTYVSGLGGTPRPWLS